MLADYSLEVQEQRFESMEVKQNKGQVDRYFYTLIDHSQDSGLDQLVGDI
jgi:hypothetical protein